MSDGTEFVVAVDVDNTLIGHENRVNWDVVDLIRALSNLGAIVVVWSGGGKQYAEMWARRLGLEPFVDEFRAKDKSLNPTFTVDDGPETDFGCPNLLVRPIKYEHRN